jgi:methionine-rich copper-binding protein CopC
MSTPQRSRAWLAPGLALAALLGSAVSAAAHAQYGDSNPEANATMSSLPTMLTVTYTQELASIQIAVTGPDGSNVTTGPASFDLNERHHASVPIRSAGPGTYTVVWHNGHRPRRRHRPSRRVRRAALQPAQPRRLPRRRRPSRPTMSSTPISTFGSTLTASARRSATSTRGRSTWRCSTPRSPTARDSNPR